MQQLNPELLAVVLAGILSLLATYIPGFNSWFAGLATEVKQAIMGVATILIAVVVYILACVPEIGFPYVSCPTGGIWELVSIIFLALAANQGAFLASPQPGRVKAAKVARAAQK